MNVFPKLRFNNNRSTLKMYWVMLILNHRIVFTEHFLDSLSTRVDIFYTEIVWQKLPDRYATQHTLKS